MSMVVRLCAIVLFSSIFVSACAGGEQDQTEGSSPPPMATEPGDDPTDAPVQPEPADEPAEVDPPPDEPFQEQEQELEQAVPTATETWERSDPPPGEGLAEIAAVIARAADVRLRPGLAWSVVERLPVGEAIRVRARIGIWNEPGWLRIGYGEAEEGWIRANTVDLSEAEMLELPERPARKLVGQISDRRVGVIGRHPNGAVRGLEFSGQQPRRIQIPRNAIDMGWGDVSFLDLPVIVPTEDGLVVFPSDQIRIREARILPGAGHWIWLPSGSLRGVQASQVWTWSPETNKTEYFSFPNGRGILAPDGEWLAVFQWASDGSCDDPDFPNNVILVPLAGSNSVSLCEQFQRKWPNRNLYERSRSDDWQSLWLTDGEAILFDVLVDIENNVSSNPDLVVALMTREGEITLYELPQDHLPVADVTSCETNRSWDIEIRPDDSLVFTVACYVPRQNTYVAARAAFRLSGEFLRWEPIDDLGGPAGNADTELVRNAAGGDDLGAELIIHWSPTRRHALVVSRDTTTLWLYDASEQHLRVVSPALVNVRLPEGRETWIEVDWEAYWHTDERVAVLAVGGIYPHERRNLGSFLIEVQSATAVQFDAGSISNVSWLPSGDWSPDGEFFKMLFWESLDSRLPREGFWLDGLAGGYFGQIVVVRRDGSLVAAVRTNWSNFQGAWSPDGSWFAVGPSH